MNILSAAAVFFAIPALGSSIRWSKCLAITALLSALPVLSDSSVQINGSKARYLDGNDGRDWPGYGRSFGQQHYSPLEEIDETSINRLGLAWSMDLGPENSATQPIVVDGVLYFATGLSVVHAVDAVSGELRWRYDPGTAEKSGFNLRFGWGVRGIAWWDGRIYTGTQDGRLIAIDAKTGKLAWSVQTFDSDYPAHINGAPRVFDGRVIVGYASAVGPTRGYVTSYDARTGKQLWRFFTVPGNPTNGFENEAMEIAAQTWAGKWWTFGGGGDVWNAIAYDPDADTVFIGTGSGYPWNHRVRSAGLGDNLFVSSIVALEGATGKYKWHYQVNPGDTWDYDATMDIELADLTINGEIRKVLMQAPKNGFYYVIDRITGQLISAQPYTKVTWASGIDLKTGRPIERPGVRYPNGATAEIWPGWGAHSWMPMAFSPKTRLTYIPVIENGHSFNDERIDLKSWRPPTNRIVDGAVGISRPSALSTHFTATNADRAGRAMDFGGALVAWDAVAQRPAWKVSHPTYVNGGVLATAGGLVFQGTIDGNFRAYSATTGRALWSFAAGTPLVATPISYSVGGHQYVTLLTGLGMGIVAGAGTLQHADQYELDSRSQARRVLTFTLDGDARLPSRQYMPLKFIEDPEFKYDATSATAGARIYGQQCAQCHGASAIAVTHAPDLRRSGVLLSVDAFAAIVRDGGLVPRGMPAFKEFTDEQLMVLRHYLRARAALGRDRTAHHHKD